MTSKIIIHDIPPGLSIGGHNVNLGEMIKYADLIDRVVSVGKATTHLAAGAEVKLPVVQFEIDGKDYEWDLGTLRRTK